MTTKIRYVNDHIKFQVYMFEKDPNWTYFILHDKHSSKYQHIAEWAFNKDTLKPISSQSDIMKTDNDLLYSKKKDAFLDMRSVLLDITKFLPKPLQPIYHDELSGAVATFIIVISSWLPIEVIDPLVKNDIISEEIEVPTEYLLLI
jgi:hypothetical protein